MKIEVTNFGKTNSQPQTHLIRIENEDGTSAEFTDYGAAIRSLRVKNNEGELVNVVLGYESAEEYEKYDACLGAVVGRYANRIRKARFNLSGHEYKLYPNDGENTLHGGKKGFDKYVWEHELCEDGVAFTLFSPDGDEGFPGNMTVRVRYIFKENTLFIKYTAVCDSDTVLNLTNHSYFNLNGGKGNILKHKLKLNASHFTELDDNTLPTGKVLSVNGTALDFTYPHEILKFIDDEEPRRFKGYDHNFIIDAPGLDKPFAALSNESGSLCMLCFTDQPGVQLYTANFLTRRLGFSGEYHEHSGVCLETQHFPNSPNEPQFPSTLIEGGKYFQSTTIYKFCEVEEMKC